VPTDVTLPAGEAAELVAAASKRVAEGFTTLKIKVGADPEGDLDRIKAVREAVGGDVALRLDANQGWERKQAVRIVSAMEDAGLGVELVEQPTNERSLDDLAYVTSHVATPILADESVRTPRDLTRIISSGAADAVNVKLAKCGGLRAARAMLETARQHGVGTTIGSMMEGRIGVAAAASLAAACGITIMADLDAAWWLRESDEALRYQDGVLHLDTGPGLSFITFPPEGDLPRRADDGDPG
ncbi:MAG: enolase C-terminal domain-like protein, partial [Stackebrandtia sp.]